MLYREKFDDYCYHCMRPCLCMIPCKSCTLVMYCSEECRTASWHRCHDIECPIQANLKTHNNDEDLMLRALNMFAVALKKHKDLQELSDHVTKLESEVVDGIEGCDADGRYHSTGLRACNKLMQHKHCDNNLEVMCALIVDCLDAGQLFHGLPKKIKTYTSRLLMRYMRIILNNYYNVPDFSTGKMEIIGAGLYTVAALFNYRCIPNTYYLYGDTFVLTAILPIAKGEQVFVSSYNADITRMKSLQRELGLHETETYCNFKCGCLYCTNALPAGTVVPHCPRCRTMVPWPLMCKAECSRCKHCFDVCQVILSVSIAFTQLVTLDSRSVGTESIPEISKLISQLHNSVAMSSDVILAMLHNFNGVVEQAGLYFARNQ